MKSKYKAAGDNSRCVACGVCAKVCPRGAISIVRGCYSQIDEQQCIGCGICVKACPAGIIKKVERI